MSNTHRLYYNMIQFIMYIQIVTFCRIHQTKGKCIVTCYCLMRVEGILLKFYITSLIMHELMNVDRSDNLRWHWLRCVFEWCGHGARKIYLWLYTHIFNTYFHNNQRFPWRVQSSLYSLQSRTHSYSRSQSDLLFDYILFELIKNMESSLKVLFAKSEVFTSIKIAILVGLFLNL